MEKKQEKTKHEEHKCGCKSNKEKCTNNHETIPKQKYEELKDVLQRTHAEFQNYQKRTNEEKSKFIKLSNEELIKKIIPILDNFEIALNHAKENTEFAQGMNHIYKQLQDVLEQEGLQKIKATGKFDPNIHEAILTEETDKEQGQILQELQKGYTLNGKIIRTTKVKISKKETGGR